MQQQEQRNFLERFCIDVTKQARDGKLDPVIGRHDEIRRVIQILSRRTKNNPVLVGDPGVGKTAIVEGIAQRLINNDVPEGLQGSRILSLDLGLLIAGAKYQGEFEDRLKGVLKEIENTPDSIILFIDEIHMLVGAGASGGAMDAANLLKPALARGMLRVVGATTVAEYKQYIEKDAALERRLQKVSVEEPTVEDAISIMRGLKEKYEMHHGIRISDKAIVKAVTLSARMIPDRFLPDKAIDVIDEAAAMVKMAVDAKPEAMDKLERSVRQLEVEKAALKKETDEVSKKRLSEVETLLSERKKQYEALEKQWRDERKPLEQIQKLTEQIETARVQFQNAERSGDFARASQLKYGTLAELEKQLLKAQQDLSNRKPTFIKEMVDEEDVAHVLARWMKIPVEKLQETEADKLLRLEEILHERVIGQNQAISAVADTIRTHRAGMAESNKPFGSFLFLGPTGVGKTEVARTLADYLFDDENKMVRLDMSEYMERHAVARLIGAPPGYVGYEQGGQLTEQVRRNPYSVLLCDEIEKAHPDVFNIFLQILDEGKLTDGQGRTVSFANCIVIMTSNLGADRILQAPEIDTVLKKELDQLLLTRFRPEFINRIDQIVYFEALTSQDVARIINLQLAKVSERMHVQEKTIIFSEEVLKKIHEIGFSKEFGARPIKRAIQQFLVGPLSKYLLQHPEVRNVSCEVLNGTIVIRNQDV